MIYGVCIIAVPLIATGHTGWADDQLGSLNGTAQLIAGIVTIVIGGIVIGKIGAQRSLWIIYLVFIALLGWMIWSVGSWDNPTILMIFVIGWVLLFYLLGVGTAVISMRLSPPAIAATQYSVFMAINNMGISLAGVLIGTVAILAEPKAMLTLVIGVQAFAILVLLIAKFPTRQIGKLAE